MKIEYELDSEESAAIEAKLAYDMDKWFNEITRQLRSHRISIESRLTDQNEKCYIFTGLFGEENPATKNTYGCYIHRGVTDRSKRNVFEWINGELTPSGNGTKAIGTACKAITEMLSESYNYVPYTGTGEIFYELNQSPKQRVKEIFEDIAPTPSSS